MLDAIYNAFMNGNVCMTGGGGVGKTYLSNQIIEKLAQENKKFAVTALTGLASTHLNKGMTIHSFSGMMTFTSMADFNAVIGSKGFAAAKHLIQETDYLLVDETSMWRPDTFELFDGISRFARGNEDVPFGGMNVMLVGDFLQLPPVVAREEKVKEQWVFENESWKEGNFNTFNLTEIKRQSDKDLINGLNALRFGEYNAESKWLLKECANRPLAQEATVLMSKRKDVDEYNSYRLGLLPDKAEHHSSIVKVKDHAQPNFRRVYAELMDKNLEKEIVLKIGCRVMITANMVNGLKNGNTGIYKGLKKVGNESPDLLGNDFMNEVMVIQLDNGKEVYLGRLRLSVKNRDGQYNDSTGEPLEDGFISQFPIKLAYAITIHKSQGMTLDNVMVDTRGIFAEGQIYVAASRARNLEGLSIMGFNKRHIKANQKAINFYKGLQ